MLNERSYISKRKISLLVTTAIAVGLIAWGSISLVQASRREENLKRQHIQDEMIRHQLENDRDTLQQEKEKLKKDLEAKAEAKKQLALASTKTIKYASKVDDSNACVVAMKAVFPQSEWENAKLTISKESGGNPSAVSPTNDHGCFQIHEGLQNYGHVVYDPNENAKIAVKMFNNRGWTPWYAVRGILWG